MYKNKAPNGNNNLCGPQVKRFRLALPGSPSQRQFADMLQLAGFDIGKNGIQQIECGARFVTDIELKTLVKVLGVSYEDLLEGGA